MKHDLEEIRKIMGVCPQHNTLFDDLTVKEHLVMFANFKGMAKNKISAAIDKILDDMDLAEKKN